MTERANDTAEGDVVDEQPVLLLGTPRQAGPFASLIARGRPMTSMVVLDLSEREFQDAVAEVRAWQTTHPGGAVISLSDEPSLVHACAGVPGASLDAILMTLDKAWARATVLSDLGGLATTTLSARDATIPSPSGMAGEPVIVKPLEGCASQGIVVAHAGDDVPDGFASSRDWVSALRLDRLGPAPYLSSTIATVEPYVAADIARVSVDGFVDAEGNVRRFAISDNVYIDGEPERFDHQMFPSHISPVAADACWNLYDSIAGWLVEHSDLRNQAFDVEMFVYDGEQPSVDVMEINARVHPNITPILQGCLVGGDPIAASFVPPESDATTDGARFAAGAMFYVWHPGPDALLPPESESESVEAFEHMVTGEPDVVFCRFDEPSGPPDGMQCHGWFYLFGDSPDALRHRARQLLADT